MIDFIVKNRMSIVVLLISIASVAAMLWLVTPDQSSLPDLVDRDLADIVESDTLRVITRNHPLTFYLYRGMRRGFDFELIQKFAEEKDLVIQVVIPPKWVDMYSYLYEGKGDVIASQMTVTPERNSIVRFTKPYMQVCQVAVGTDESAPPTSLTELEGNSILVRRGSSYDERLRELRRSGMRFNILYLDEENYSEDPVQLVAQGKYPLTVVDNSIADLEQHFYPGLLSGVKLSDEQDIAWAVRPNSPKLADELNEFLTRQDRSAFFNVLKKRYFKNKDRFLKHRSVQIAFAQKGQLSTYDEIFKKAEEDTEFDWRFLAAQSYHESRFQPDLVSWAGAVGLMQLMPRTARSLGIQNIYDPEENIMGGARYMRYLYTHYDFPEEEDDRMRFALAAYNAGLGHIANARRLAGELGGDPDNWNDVARALSKLERPEYYNKEGYAFVRGRSVRRYVADVLHRYQIFQKLMDEEEIEEEKPVFVFDTLEALFSPMLAAMP